ncbi:MAG: hypothetical protein Q9190_004637 [Brigantiaea leucoxantha]
MPLIVPGLNPATASATSSDSQEDWTAKLTGKTITDDNTSDETKFSKSELPANHRVLEHDAMTTQEHDPER